jgi:hypothetical protein
MSNSTTVIIVTSRPLHIGGRPYPAGSRVEVPAHEAYEIVTLGQRARFERAADEEVARNAARAELQRVMRETLRPPAHDPAWVHSGRF